MFRARGANCAAPLTSFALFRLFALLALVCGAGSVLGRALGRGSGEGGEDAENAMPAGVAVAFGLPIGLLAAAFLGWLLSSFGPVSIGRCVLPLGGGVLLAAILLLRKERADLWRLRREIVAPLLLGALFFGLFLYLRFPFGEIRQTEKPMDFAVLTALTTTPSLPLSDPWLAGERFSYYHFGTLLLALPVRAAGVTPEIAYNFLAALLAGMVGMGAWGAVRLRGGGGRLALLASLLVVLGGTFEGARQLLSHRALSQIDFWSSSRRVAHAITEWPLFTLRLGDLHPHAVVLPLLLVLAGCASRFRAPLGVLFDALVLAAILSANPWDLPASLLILSAGALATLPFRSALLRCAVTVAAAIPFLVPYLLSPHPPFLGLRLSPEGTTSPEAFLHLGALLVVPALALGIGLIRTRIAAEEALVLATLFPALGIAFAIVTGRPVLGLAAAFVAGVVFLIPRSSGALRTGFLLSASGAVLVALPDIVVVIDTYGDDLRRMNTLFKCWAGATPLLAIGSALLLPLVLSTRRARRTIRLLLAASVAAILVHPAAALVQRRGVDGGTLDGLRFLSPGDRGAVSWLRAHAPPDAIIAEASGLAYDEHGRIGTASGRPTLLGWSSHEGIWRGEAFQGEIDSRQNDLKTIYTTTDPEIVREIVRRRRIRFVVVGPLERTDFGAAPFPAAPSFPKVFDENGTALFEVR